MIQTIGKDRGQRLEEEVKKQHARKKDGLRGDMSVGMDPRSPSRHTVSSVEENIRRRTTTTASITKSQHFHHGIAIDDDIINDD